MTKNDNKPQFRFKGFTDAWEQCEFKEFAEIKRGLTYSPNDLTSEGIRVLRSSNICEDTFVIEKDDVFVKREAVKISLVKNGDILITSANGSSRLVGKHAIIKGLKEDSAVHGGFMLIARSLESEFLNALMGASWYTKFINLYVSGGNGAIGNLSKNDLDNQFILIPLKNERDKLGKFFTSIENLITLHQRKLEKLQKIKKFCLEKFFPKNGSNFPEIRFKGFNNAWEQRKLSDFLTVSKLKNNDEVFNKEHVLSVSGEYGIVNQIEFQGRSFAGVSVANYGVVETGDIVYTKSPLKSNPYGIIKTNKCKPGIVSTLYAVYKPKDNTAPEFVQTYFEQDARMNNYMHPLVNKGAKNDMKVSAENALKGLVFFPCKKEQLKISEFFANLDNLITLHQRKLEKLQKIKKFCLEKMVV